MNIDHLKPTDLDAVTAICTLTLSHDCLTPEDLRHGIFNDPGCEDRWNLAVRESGEVVGFVVGALRKIKPGENLGLVKIFSVHPRAQRKGVAAALLDRLEGELRSAGAGEVVVGSRGPLYFFGGVDPRYTEAYLFLKRRGYEKLGDSFYLCVDLRAPLPEYRDEIDRLAAEGITFHRPALAEKGEVQQWLMKTFGEGWSYETGLAFRPEKVTVWIARSQGRICGFATSHATLRDYFGPTGVSPDFRRKGIGRIVLVKCLRDMQDDGRPRAWIPTGLERIPYYHSGAGARVGRVFWRMGKTLK